MDAGIIVAVVSGIVGLAAAIYSARSAARTSASKTESEERLAIRQIEAGAYERAKGLYEASFTRMQGEIDRQTARVTVLERQVSRLTRQVRDAGLVPATSSEDEM